MTNVPVEIARVAVAWRRTATQSHLCLDVLGLSGPIRPAAESDSQWPDTCRKPPQTLITD